MLAGFRCELCRCLGRRRDALFELADGVLCKQDRVHMAAELSLEPECRRGHGGELALADPATWPDPQVTTSTLTSRYGTAVAAAWDRVHPRLTHRGAWLDHDGDLPVIEGTLIRLQVDHLPGDRDPKPAWLWFSRTGATPAEVDRCWQAFLRRFDLEHTFRLFKQVLGWTAPKIRSPEAADRWTWLIIACYAQLRLARPLAADLRLPWQRPCPPGRLTPARVRRDFRNIRATAGCPASAPKLGKPGPGRPPGLKNRRPAPRHDVGKTTKETSRSRPGANGRVKRQAKVRDSYFGEGLLLCRRRRGALDQGNQVRHGHELDGHQVLIHKLDAELALELDEQLGETQRVQPQVSVEFLSLVQRLDR